MLKKIRVVVSILTFVLITFFFLDFRDVLPQSFKFLAEIQIVPAILKGSFVILIALFVVTLLFGRIYCSSVCPMGIFQDIVDWLSKRASKKKKRYKYSPAKNILRWSVLAVTIIAFLLGFPVLLGLMDPYSAYGRMIVNVFRPVYLAGNNLLETIFSSFGNYSFYRMEVFVASIFSLIIGIVTFFAIGFLAWKYGRTYCNTICPVGTVLGLISKFSIFKLKIDTDACHNCGLCALRCKASCIDSKNHSIDYSRCIMCFNCIEVCNDDAIDLKMIIRKKAESSSTTTEGVSRRQFLLTGAASALTIPAAIAQDKIADLTGNSGYLTKHPISPPGSLSAEHLSQHCTSCHLCISKCPVNVLKPAFTEYGIGGIMQPRMYFEKGFCNYDCTVCADVCPNGALIPLSKEQKHRTQMGYVVLHRDICVVTTDGTNCGACAEHCPTQAVTMVPYENGLTIPKIDPEICVGCGGCEFICPVRPYRAIVVEGNVVHKEAKAFVEEEQKEIEIDGFGF